MISFRNPRFIGSFPQFSQLPADQGSEIALVGRSNVGKSSLINALTGRKKLAKSSSTPGKTREIVLFELEPGRRLSDLPGYGYAKVSHKEQQFWARELTTYLVSRESLKGVVMIMDMRHPLTDLDRDMLQILRNEGRALILVLNKADKLKQGEKVQSLRKVEAYLKEQRFPALIHQVSAEKGQGLEDLRKSISQWLEA